MGTHRFEKPAAQTMQVSIFFALPGFPGYASFPIPLNLGKSLTAGMFLAVPETGARAKGLFPLTK